MPALLKRLTIKFLEASQGMLGLAISGLSSPPNAGSRVPNARYAGPVGLIGAALELAMSACLVEAWGSEALRNPSTSAYRTAREILGGFRKLLGSSDPRASFITKGIEDPDEHRNNLHRQSIEFGCILLSRAAGLHAAFGPESDVCARMARQVATFLTTLALSSRMRPYLRSIPSAPGLLKERVLILEDLARTIKPPNSLDEAMETLASLYLALPEAPTEYPPWLQSLEEVSIPPKKEDLKYFLNVLESAHAAELVRVSAASGEALHVAVTPSDPHALPIAPYNLKRTLSSTAEEFAAAAALANAGLEKGRLNLPLAQFVLDLVISEPDELPALGPNGMYSPHQSWSSILSSLARPGTPGPYWFLVRKTPDLGQLQALLERATALSSSYVQKRLQEITGGLRHLKEDTPLSPDSPALRPLADTKRTAKGNRRKLSDAVTRSDVTAKKLPRELAEEVNRLSRTQRPVGPVLLKIVDADSSPLNNTARQYWSCVLSEVACDKRDLRALVAILNSKNLTRAHTSARKAVRLIDFLTYGPRLSRKSE